MSVLRWCAIAALLWAPSCASQPLTPASSGVSFEERLLATIPDEWDVSYNWNSITFSPTGRSVAYVVYLPYQGAEGATCFVVHEGKKGPVVTDVGATAPIDTQGAPVFSRDGKQLAYAALLGPSDDQGPWAVVIDGKLGPSFSDVGDPVFSPDGRRVAYEAWQNGKKIVVLDGRPLGCEFAAAEGPIFSPDSKRLLFRSWRKGPLGRDGELEWEKTCVVVDGVSGPEFDWIDHSVWEGPIFSPDSRTVAYSAAIGEVYFVMRGDEKSGPFDESGSLAFSPDGRQFACLTRQGKDDLLVLNDSRQKIGLQFASSPQFSSDGRRLAYKATRPGSGESEYGKRQCVVVDGVAGEDCDYIHDIVFSPDGSRFGFTMIQNKQDYVVVDRVKYGGEFNSNEDLAFSPDGRSFAYVADHGGDMFVVCGNQRSEPFDIVRDPVFSPDGRKIAFAARKGRELWWKVMDVK